jgi:phosphoribosylformylglycinamidine cyclo-ligase
VFGWLARAGRLDDAEMLRTFNCGMGMVIVAAKADADGLVRVLQEWGEAPHVIGEIAPPSGVKGSAKGKGEAWAVAYDGTLKYGA